MHDKKSSFIKNKTEVPRNDNRDLIFIQFMQRGQCCRYVEIN